MKTNEIKAIVKEITGFEYIAVRKGRGSMSGYTNIYSSSNDGFQMTPFREKLEKVFDIEMFSPFTITIK